MYREADKLGIFGDPKTSEMGMVFFLELVKANPDKADAWCTALADLKHPASTYLGIAYQYAASPAASACLARLDLAPKAREGIPKLPPWNLLKGTPNSARTLDMLWAMFFATGDKRAVNKIVDTLAVPTPVDEKGGVSPMYLVKMSAEWSLGSNAQQHPEVAKALRARMKREEKKGNTELAETLKKLLTKSSSKGVPPRP